MHKQDKHKNFRHVLGVCVIVGAAVALHQNNYLEKNKGKLNDDQRKTPEFLRASGLALAGISTLYYFILSPE